MEQTSQSSQFTCGICFQPTSKSRGRSCQDCKQLFCDMCTLPCTICKLELCQVHSHKFSFCPNCRTKKCSMQMLRCSAGKEQCCVKCAGNCPACQNWLCRRCSPIVSQNAYKLCGKAWTCSKCDQCVVCDLHHYRCPICNSPLCSVCSRRSTCKSCNQPRCNSCLPGCAKCGQSLCPNEPDNHCINCFAKYCLECAQTATVSCEHCYFLVCADHVSGLVGEKVCAFCESSRRRRKTVTSVSSTFVYKTRGTNVLEITDTAADSQEPSNNIVPGAEHMEPLGCGEGRFFFRSQAGELCYVDFRDRFVLVHTWVKLPKAPLVCYSNSKTMYAINIDPEPSFRVDLAPSSSKACRIPSVPAWGNISKVRGCLGPRFITVFCFDTHWADVSLVAEAFVLDTAEEESGWRSMRWEREGFFELESRFPDTEPLVENTGMGSSYRFRIDI